MAWMVGLALLAVPLSAVATGWLRRVLQARKVLDTPNARSSHSVPTPRGGGLAVLAVALALCAVGWLFGAPVSWHPWALLAGAVVLAALSFADDLGGLGAGKRFAVQALCVGLGLAALPAGALGLGGLLPEVLGGPLVFLGWLWFVNLYNFMDGIDGLTGVETISLGLGTALVAGCAGMAMDQMMAGPILAGAALGFLWWNWHPARIFLGDVGSVPLGYLLGALLAALAAEGHLAAALILPGYYLADATLTLGRRALRGAKVWQAHREHFYQRATQGGWPHDRVSLWVGGLNGVLAGLALWSTRDGCALPALAAGIVAIALVLGTFARAGRGRTQAREYEA
nr:glycosyltransferase family 4 protein [Rhodospirillum rubrum]